MPNYRIVIAGFEGGDSEPLNGTWTLVQIDSDTWKAISVIGPKSYYVQLDLTLNPLNHLRLGYIESSTDNNVTYDSGEGTPLTFGIVNTSWPGVIVPPTLIAVAINETTESVDFTESLVVEIISEHPTYGSVQEADRYFGVLLHGELWERSTNIRKYKALVTATKQFDTLRYSGVKTSADQALEFPRFGQTTVPLAIRQACYEEALSLLKGVDPTTEYDNLFVRSRGFGSLRTDYEPQNPAEHKKAGITSLRAWQMLLPYLKPALDLKLRRES
jgi:hypothetical protein